MKLDDVFLNVDFIGLDTSPFIYFVEQNPLYVDVMREIFKRVTIGDFRAASSVITLTEVLVQPLRQSNQNLADEYRDLLFNGANFQLFSLTRRNCRNRRRTSRQTQSTHTDALQIATALENGCDAFLCNDNDLKRVTEIKILILDEIEL